MWTDATIGELKKLYADGLSMSQIGAELGKTRNAIMGKIHRLDKDGSLGFALRGGPAPGPKKPRKSRRKPKILKHIFDPPKIEIPPEPDVPPSCSPVALVDLKSHQCRWPIGDGPYLFCAADKENGSSYCAYHHRIAYPPSHRLTREEWEIRQRMRRRQLSNGVSV